MSNKPYVSRFIQAAGLATHYLQAGDTGMPIVLVHGGGAGADCEGNWAAVMVLLAKHFRVYAPDMVGFGRSAKPDEVGYGYTQAERDTHLAAFIRALNVGPVVLVGNSMGGLTSLGVAREHPELVHKLVLMGSAGIPIPASPQLKAIMDYDFTPEGMTRIVDALTGPGFQPPEGMVAYRHALSVDPATKMAYLRITGWAKARGGLQIDEAEITAVRTPTLVVSGKNDQVVPVSCAYRFLELIPGSRGYIMPDCGHWPMIEHPVEFASILEHFIASPSARTQEAAA
jgi:2-hydroxy-6-oxo-6-(2'-aminophenyl)hexa-2,4-dienoate hydrolase